jgi:hypothetical protein
MLISCAEKDVTLGSGASVPITKAGAVLAAESAEDEVVPQPLARRVTKQRERGAIRESLMAFDDR